MFAQFYSLSYVIFNAKMTLFDLTLAHNKDIANNVIFALKMTYTERMTLNDSCHKHAKNPSFVRL